MQIMEMKQGLLQFDDARFWDELSVPFETRSALLRADPGLYLDGPGRCALTEHDDIAFVGARVTQGQEHLQVSLRRKAALVGLRLDDNLLSVGAAFAVALSEDPIPVSRPVAADDRSATSEVFQTNLNRLETTLEAGEYRSWIVLFDRASNPVTTTVVAPEIVDPEVRALVEQSQAEVYAGPVSPPPGHPWPNYQKGLSSPTTPAEVGINLSVPRVTVARGNLPLLVHGSFRVPVLPCERVHPVALAEAARRRAEFIGEGSPPPLHDAVVTIHLLLIGNTQSGPEVVRLAVPAVIDAATGSTAVGYFVLDLHQHLVLDPQTYAVWTIAGGELRGPALAALVSPDLLARPRA